LVLGGVLVAGIAAAVWFVMDSGNGTDPADAAGKTADAAHEDAAAGKSAVGNRRPKAKGTASVVGEVRRSKGRVPVADQEVQLLPEKGDPWTVKTDARGAFQFAELPHGGPYELRVAAPKCGTIRIPGIALDRNEKRDVGTLWLDPSVRVTVQVRTWSDQPVEGALVEAYAIAQSDNFDWTKAYAQMGAAPVAVTKAPTDAEGKAVFPELATGRWTFTATKQGYARSGRAGVTVRPDVEPPPVKLYLGTGHPLSGKVTDAAKAAVPGALLLAGAPSNAWDLSSAPLRARATTDAQGHYEFAALDAGDTVLMVGRPGGGVPAPVATVRIPNISVYDVVLKGTATITGAVTEKDSGKPVDSATVRAWTWGNAGATVAEATTDATGKFSVMVVEGMVNQILAEKDGWVAADDASRQQTPIQIREGETQTRDLKLRPGAKVTGVVRGPDGPLPGAKVWAHSGSNNMRWIQKSAATDADGRYEIGSLAPGRVLVRAEYAGYYVKDFPDQYWVLMQQQGPSPFKVEVTEGGTATKDIEMVRGVAVEGRVEGPDGPMSGVRVSTPTDWEGGAVTGEGGTFRVEGVKPSANVQLYAVKEGFAPAATNKPFAVSSDKPTTDVVLKMVRVGTVRGTVTASDGGPLKDAQVKVSAWQDQGGDFRGSFYNPNSAGVAAPVRPDGSYEVPLGGMPSGKFMVTVTAVDRPSVSSDAQPIVDGQSDYTVNLTMDAGKDLQGTVVVKQGGAAVPGASVAIQSRSGRTRSMTMVNGMYMNDTGGQTVWAVTDSDGRFSISHLAPGSYGVTATATGYVVGTSLVDLNATGVVTVEVEQELTIEGVVMYADRSPVEGAQINASRDAAPNQPTDQSPGGVAWTTTGSGGRFRLTGLSSGLFRLNVSGDWQGSLNIRSKRSDPIAAGSTDVAIVVDAGGVIAGRVTDPQKKGLAGIWVFAMPEPKDGRVPDGAEQRNVRTRDDGTFSVGGLTDVTTFQLNVQANQGWDVAGGSTLRNASLKGVAVGTANLEIVLEEGLTVSGTVVDADRNPVANTYLQCQLLQPDGGGVRLSRNAMTDDKGAFTFGGLDAGDCQISLVDYGGPGGSLVIENGDKIPAGSSGVQLRASKGLTITGTVVDEGNTPLKNVNVNAMPTAGGRSRSGRSKDDGSYEITGLSAGVNYKLIANSPGRVIGKATDVAPGSAPVRLVCSKGLDAAGRVLDESNAPVRNGNLMLTLSNDGDYATWTQTDGDGNFKASGLVDATYDAQCINRASGKGGLRKCGSVKAGDTACTLTIVADK
jgi:protocatechuate 3,4-dioxygenase beta subunit